MRVRSGLKERSLKFDPLLKGDSPARQLPPQRCSIILPQLHRPQGRPRPLPTPRVKAALRRRGLPLPLRMGRKRDPYG